MNPNSDAISGGRTLAEIVSAAPPVPPEILAMVANTGYGRRNLDWATPNRCWNAVQMIIGLVVIEQSVAGEVWGVKLAVISGELTTPASDTRYTIGTGSPKYLTEAVACVERFFMKSKLGENAPMATVAWNDPTAIANTNWSGIGFSCDIVCKMLYAAQELESRFGKDARSRTAMETRIAGLEAQNATLSSELQQVNMRLQDVSMKLQQVGLELQQVTSHFRSQSRAPTVTCLMHLFAGYTEFRYTNCDPAGFNDVDSNAASPLSSSNQDISTQERTPHHVATSPDGTRPKFNIAPHTDRLSSLSPDAQDWFLKQLDTRSVWVHVTKPDSYDNHISWSPFSGGVEMTCKNVVFMYGNHRFW